MLDTQTVSSAEIVNRGWQAVGQGDWDTLIADYTDDMVFAMPGQNDELEGKSRFPERIGKSRCGPASGL